MLGKNKQPKVKELSPREIAINRIAGEVEQLASGQTFMYKLPEFYWGFAAFFIVELNPSYPEKGRKYIMSTDKIGDGGKPAGQKMRAWDSNKPKDVADWIVQRSGERYS